VSIEQLRKDMKESTAALAQLCSTPGKPPTVEGLAGFIHLTMWPTLESVVDELGDVDGCVEDLLNASEDILQPETAQLFAALVVAGRGMAAELSKRLTAADAETRQLVAGFLELATAAEAAISEITVPEDDDDDDDDEDDAKGTPQ
jgi:hypothetical protein